MQIAQKKQSRQETSEKLRTGVEREVENFLVALSSYPQWFAINPEMSFAEYFSTISVRTNAQFVGRSLQS